MTASTSSAAAAARSAVREERAEDRAQRRYLRLGSVCMVAGLAGMGITWLSVTWDNGGVTAMTVGIYASFLFCFGGVGFLTRAMGFGRRASVLAAVVCAVAFYSAAFADVLQPAIRSIT